MSRQNIFRFLVVFGLICVVIVVIASVRSCHISEDPQDVQDDDITSVAPAPAEYLRTT